MTNKPKVNLAFVETLPESPVKGTVYMSPDSAEGFLKVGIGDNETETIFDSSVYAKKSDSVWVAGEGVNSAVLKDSSSRAMGTGAVAHGYDTSALGYYSHTEGGSTTASGQYSHAEGYGTTASGQYSHAEGKNAKASGQYSHAEGGSTTASGQYSHAEGFYTRAFGQSSHAEGCGSLTQSTYTVSGSANTKTYTASMVNGLRNGDIVFYNSIYAKVVSVSGKEFTLDKTLSAASALSAVIIHVVKGVAYDSQSHVEGYNTTASGQCSHAEGYGTIASRQSSHAEGQYTIASGQFSHAEGFNTIASDNHSHAEGSNTHASGRQSHAEGNGAVASGLSSHAEGDGTLAFGISSHAEGLSTQAINDFEHAQGMFNISRVESLFSIGNGYENSDLDPGEDSIIYRNALEIMRNGDAYLYGVASFDGQTISNEKTLQYFLNIDSISNNEYDTIFSNAVDFDTITRLHLYIDDYPSDMISDMMEEVGVETVEEFYDIVYDVNVNSNTQYNEIGCVHANEYVYEDTVEIDGTSYYLWYNSDADMYAIMHTDITMDYLDSIAKCNNPDSNISPFVAIVMEDLAVRYDDNTDKNVNNDYQLACYKIDEE